MGEKGVLECHITVKDWSRKSGQRIKWHEENQLTKFVNHYSAVQVQKSNQTPMEASISIQGQVPAISQLKRKGHCEPRKALQL